eukprot:scaffold94539_cov17-Prasinocladus_malaysianus.AAC.1
MSVLMYNACVWTTECWTGGGQFGDALRPRGHHNARGKPVRPLQYIARGDDEWRLCLGVNLTADTCC